MRSWLKGLDKRLSSSRISEYYQRKKQGAIEWFKDGTSKSNVVDKGIKVGGTLAALVGGATLMYALNKFNDGGLRGEVSRIVSDIYQAASPSGLDQVVASMDPSAVGAGPVDVPLLGFDAQAQIADAISAAQGVEVSQYREVWDLAGQAVGQATHPYGQEVFTIDQLDALQAMKNAYAGVIQSIALNAEVGAKMTAMSIVKYASAVTTGAGVACVYATDTMRKLGNTLFCEPISAVHNYFRARSEK